MLSGYCYAVKKQQRRISGGSECALRYPPLPSTRVSCCAGGMVGRQGYDGSTPTVSRLLYCFSILQLQRISTLSCKEARSSRNRAHEQYGLLSSFVPLHSLLKKPPKPTSEPQTLAGSFLLLPFTIALQLDFLCIATTMTQYVAGSTGQRPNAGGRLTGVRSVAAVSGQPYAVPAEARAPLIGQGETNRAERTGPK